MTIKKQENQETEEKKIHYFSPDRDLKRLFKEMPPSQVIRILNAIFSIYFSEELEVEFIDTESSIVVGDNNSFVRSDLVVKLKDKEGNTDQIVIEFQSTPDKLMGIRLYIYTINHSKLEYNKDEQRLYCDPARCITIYTDPTKKLLGVDKVSIKKRKYEPIGPLKFKEIEYYEEEEYPFINILGLALKDLETLDDTDLDIFKILYLYKYKRKKSLLLKEDYILAVEKAQEIVKKYEGENYSVLKDIFLDLCEDITDIIKTDNKYSEVYEKMQVIYRSRSQELRQEGIKEGLEKGRKESYDKIVKAEQETNKIKQEKLEVLKKTAKLLGITLEEFEEKLKNIPKE